MEIQFVVGKLTEQAVDAIVNPTNSEGEMGHEVGATILRSGGKKIEREVMAQAPIAIGRTAVTDSGRLPCQHIIHAPITAMPVQRTSVKKIEQAMDAALETAVEHEFHSLAIPGMGLGTGKVSLQDAAQAMIAAVRKFSTRNAKLQDVVLIDKNEDLIVEWEECWRSEEDEEAVEDPLG